MTIDDYLIQKRILELKFKFGTIGEKEFKSLYLSLEERYTSLNTPEIKKRKKKIYDKPIRGAKRKKKVDCFSISTLRPVLKETRIDKINNEIPNFFPSTLNVGKENLAAKLYRVMETLLAEKGVIRKDGVWTLKVYLFPSKGKERINHTWSTLSPKERNKASYFFELTEKLIESEDFNHDFQKNPIFLEVLKFLENCEIFAKTHYKKQKTLIMREES